MKIKHEVLEKVRKDARLRRELSFYLNVSEQTISRYVKNNDEDSELTKIKAIRIIAEKLGISEYEILTEKGDL